jgi:hypothetical protein
MLCFCRIMRFSPRQCRLQYLFEFAQGLGARASWLGDPSLAAGRYIQHPERHFQNPRCLDVFQAAVHHRPASFYEAGMHPHCPAMPRMPGIANLAEIPNMGVVLLSCIIPSATTKARETRCSSLPRWGNRLAEVSAAASASAICFDIIAAPLEYFDHTGKILSDILAEDRAEDAEIVSAAGSHSNHGLRGNLAGYAKPWRKVPLS